MTQPEFTSEVSAKFIKKVSPWQLSKQTPVTLLKGAFYFYLQKDEKKVNRSNSPLSLKFRNMAEKRTQEQITKWAKERRAKGEEIKVGFGRVKVKGIWENWSEIKQALSKEEEKEKIKKMLRNVMLELREDTGDAQNKYNKLSQFLIPSLPAAIVSQSTRKHSLASTRRHPNARIARERQAGFLSLRFNREGLTRRTTRPANCIYRGVS